MNNNSRVVTIKDIAKKLNLSVSTVSRALSGSTNIASDTCDLIKETADKLGYMPNPLAKRLQSGKTRIVGLILPNIDDTYFADMFKAINSFLKERDHSVIAAFSEEDPVKEREYLNMMFKQHVEGIIICVCHKDYNNEVFRNMMKNGIHFVFLDRIPNLPNTTRVEIHDNNNTFFLVEHLIRSGYRKIAYIQIPLVHEFSLDRTQAYIGAMKKHHLYNDKLIFMSHGMTYADGKALVPTLLKTIDEIDSIIACSDLVAIGIMHELLKHGIKIPEDIAVVGFGGSLAAEMVTPEITTIDFPKKEMGEKAAELMVDKLVNPMQSNKKITLFTHVIYRESTLNNPQ